MIDRTITEEKFMSNMSLLALSVYDFHNRFDLEEIDLKDPNDATLKMLYKMGRQQEEIGECSRAINRSDYDNLMEEVVDNLYVAMGMVLITGSLSSSYTDDVIHKNNQKTPDNYIIRYPKRNDA